jgi:hypothetical protein
MVLRQWSCYRNFKLMMIFLHGIKQRNMLKEAFKFPRFNKTKNFISFPWHENNHLFFLSFSRALFVLLIKIKIQFLIETRGRRREKLLMRNERFSFLLLIIDVVIILEWNRERNYNFHPHSDVL